MAGSIDYIDNNRVDGWALQSDGKTPDTVLIYVDGTLVAQVVCNRLRKDLAKRGIADSTAGFRFVFPTPIGVDRPVEVLVCSLMTGKELGRKLVGNAADYFLAEARPYRASLHRRSYSVWPTVVARKSNGFDVHVRVLAPPTSNLSIASNTPAADLANLSLSIVPNEGIPPEGSVFWSGRFHVQVPSHLDQAHLQFKLTDEALLQPSTEGSSPDSVLPNPVSLFAIPLSTKWACFPEEDNMERVSGRTNEAVWSVGGLAAAHRIHAIAQHFADSPSEIRRVLDWGVGCGRVAVPLKRLFYPKANIVGCDVDRINVEWSQRNLKDVAVDLAPFFPPAPYESDTFDLVYGISVMTHLTLDAQLKWLQELRRVLKPGGICILTTHGEHSLVLRGIRDKRLIGEILAGGISDSRDDENLGPKLDLKGYYKATFQLRTQVEQVWGQFMEVLAYFPAGQGAFQDLVILKKS